MPKGFKSLKRKLRKGRRDINRKTESTTRQHLETIRADARANLAGQDAIYRAIVLNSFEIDVRGGTFTLRNVAPHAAFLEYGTGMKNIGTRAETKFDAPPLTGHLVREIKLWIRLKPGVVPLTGDLDRSAFLIARSISNQPPFPTGTPAKPFMKPAYLRQEHIYMARLKGNIKRAFR